MAFILPFEREIHALEQRCAALSAEDPAYADCRAELEALERRVYPNLGAYDRFLLSGHPLRPKALDYIGHMFREVRLLRSPRVRGDHLVVGGMAKLELGGRLVELMVIGQQTGPTRERRALLRLPVAEYKGWNQGMGYPDGYRKAVYLMEQAERRGWPVVVFVDTPGADPHESSEEEGQAFAINEVIHKTSALRVPNLSYIISLGASGGAIALTPANRTIMNEYATYMVISPGGCASILFRNRNPDSIRVAAEGLHLTSRDALAQGTVDEVVAEGLHPGHRYPEELLEKGRAAVVRNLAGLLELRGVAAEHARRGKFYAMGRWGESGDERPPETLARLARQQKRLYAQLERTLARYLAAQNRARAENNGQPLDRAALVARLAARLNVARLIYAIQKRDAEQLSRLLGLERVLLTRTQWAQLGEFVLARRYGNLKGARTLHPYGGRTPYRRLHPLDWIGRLTDEGTFREFPQTVRYCSVDQLGFPGYAEALERGLRNTGLQSGLITGTAQIGGYAAVLAINNFGLVGSSLCDEIGEKFRLAAQHALRQRTPLVSVSMGGGARMQEGTPAMHRNIPKVHHALNELEDAGVAHISVIADPTLGGTAISYGLRGDYMIVVAGSANIGFSGKRVVEQFQQRRVAPDFQQGSWLLHRGFVDEVVATDELARRLSELLEHVARGGRLAELQKRRPRRWQPLEEVRLQTTALHCAGAQPALVRPAAE